MSKPQSFLLDLSVIIARGFTLDEEYEVILKGCKLEKLNLIGKEGREGIWIYPLEDSNVAGEKFRFVFFNDPVMYMGGPRETSGLVGIATSRGSEERAVADANECLEMFKVTGKMAIDYFWERRREMEMKAKGELN